MPKPYLPVNLDAVRTYPQEDRTTKVEQGDFAHLCPRAATLNEFLDCLPNILKAKELRAVVQDIAQSFRHGQPVVLGLGGHVVKCGLGPLLIHLMEQGVLTAVIMNGGASIHDFEIAMIGRTSEDVAASLESGMFGMVHETAEWMNSAISVGAQAGMGMGRSLGDKLLALGAPNAEKSILAAGAQLGIPVLVHVAIGGDTIHMHPNADGAALGTTSFIDFRTLVSVLQDFRHGGVYLNIGSAVVLPEVFLKAINLAKNISGQEFSGFTTVNMDMIQHYRPLENVVRRPTQKDGHGYSFTGHHEIMVPLLVHLVLAELDNYKDEH